MEVRLLGPVEVVVGGEVIDLGAGRPAQLLVALTLAPGHRLTVDELVDRCFGEQADLDDPVPALRTAVRRLRRTLGDETIQTHRGGGGYELDLSDATVDIDRFQELIAAGRGTRDSVAARTGFRQALELWRGSPFGELSDHAWLDPERFRLEELHLVALEGWHAAHLRNGSATEIIPSLEAATSAHPLRERFRRQLMHALYLTDRQPEALRVFQELRAELIEAGLEPSAETVALEQRIANGDPSLREANAARHLRGYRIEERLGEGAFSIVYRGTQPAVDRPVAIKQIRAELANRPEFIRRFETEAHLVARLEHPFIVPLYDYWREPDSAYLVMRYLRGGNLETRLYDGRWDLDKTVAMVHQIGDALATAHRAGVVHRDVKPANILLDDDDNAYLADFGIAVDASEAADPAAALSAGSPAYASPEQLQRLPVGPPADVHGLAIATYEALTGHVPFPDEPNQAAMLQRQLHDPIPQVRDTRSDIPTGIDAVLAKATAKSPVDRYQSVEEFVAALDEAAAEGNASVVVASSHRTMVGAEARNPYKGLRAFDEADAGDFTGRDRLIDQLVEALDESRLVAVVGPSGSGKSSVVRAGLLPALRAGRVPGSARWFITRMMPSANPFEEMERALLRIASVRPPDLLSVLTSGERGIARAVHHTIPESDDQVLLVIDQFEELFTLADPAQTKTFLKALAIAVTDERSRLRVVLTLRADFYDRPLRHEGIGGLVKDATVAVLPLAPDELERAIVDPAHAVGVEFEPGLVAEIAADVVDQPGALPLLQYALTELYEAEVSGLMTRDAYRKLGGVAGALGRRAEDLYHQAASAEQTAIRRIFGRLVSLGEGTEDTRRRALRSELGEDATITAVIDRYGSARLLSFDRDPATRQPTVEVAHEALLREWPRLREWLDEDRDGLRILRHLHTTANEWEVAGRPESELYRGGRLEAAEEWAADHTADLTDAEEGFLAASIDRRTREEASERASKRRLQRLLAGVAAVAVIALVAGLFAFQQRSSANDARASAETARDAALASESDALLAQQAEEAARADSEIRRMIAESAVAMDGNPSLSMLLAVEAHNLAPGPGTLGAQLTSLQRTDGYLGYIAGPGADVGVADWLEVLDEDTLVVRSLESIDIYDLGSRTLVSSTVAAAGASGRVYRAEASSAAGILATTASTGEVYLVEGADRSVRTLEIADGRFATATAVGTDGSIIVGYQDGGVDVFSGPDDLSGDQVANHPAAVTEVAIGADGRFVAALDAQQNVALWNRKSGTAVWTWTTASSDDWAPDVEPLLVTVTDDGEFVNAGLIQGGPPGAAEDPKAATGAGDELLLSADGRYLYSTQPVGSGLIAFDIESGEPAWSLGEARESRRFQELSDGRLLFGNVIVDDGAIVHAFDQFGESMVAATDDGATLVLRRGLGVELWANDGRQLLAYALDRQGHSYATLSADGQQVASFEYPPNSPAVVRPANAKAPSRPAFDDAWYQAFTRQGDFVSYYTGSPDFGRTTIMRDADTFEQLSARIPPQPWLAVELSPDHRFVAVGDAFMPEVRVYRADSAALIATLTDLAGEGGRFAGSITFSPDSQLLAASGIASVVVWSTQTWEPVATIESPDAEDPLYAIHFESDSQQMILGTTGGHVMRYDIGTAELTTIGTSPIPIGGINQNIDLAMSPDDELILAAGPDGVAMIDTESGLVIGRPFPSAELAFGASLSRDGTHAVTGTQDHLLVWNLDATEWTTIACLAAGRNITAEEWRVSGPAGQPYRATCPQWPAAS